MKKRNGIAFAAFLLALLLALSACTPNLPGTSSSDTPDVNPSGKPNASTSSQAPADPNCTHSDGNDDGLCDTCGGSVRIILDFYAFNDLHGVFNDTATNPGVDELTTFLRNAYDDDRAYEIVLSSGDMWQGSVESSSNQGALMTEWMNALDFVSMTLGNHEFDWGSEKIVANAALAEFPFLAINVIDDNVETPYCTPSVTVERGGVKIGIIGAIGDCLSSISGEHIGGLQFITGNALTSLVKAEATRLREQGCDLIVYSIHEGGDSSTSGVQNVSSLDYYDMSLSDGYVDLVFEAHSHRDYVLKDRHGVYHIQAGGYNSALGYASVSYNTVTGSYDVTAADTLSQSVYADSSLDGDKIVGELFGTYFPDENPYTDVIGANLTTRESNEIADTVAQLYLEKGRELWGDEFEIVLGGGFLQCRTPYRLSAGDVTYSQLYSLLPFDNDLVLCKVTGKQLNRVFIHSNNDRYHCAYDPDLVVDENETYYVVTDTYTSFYRYNMFPEVRRLENYYARDLLRDYIADGIWGGQAETITIEQALEYGHMLSKNESTAVAYRVTGRVASIQSTMYGNLYLEDESGHSIYVYGLYDGSGRRYDRMENPPQVGDTITIVGIIKHYYAEGAWSAAGDGTIEFFNAVLE